MQKITKHICTSCLLSEQVMDHVQCELDFKFYKVGIVNNMHYCLEAFSFITSVHCLVNLERTESSGLVIVCLNCGWARSNAQHFTSITLLFMSAFIYFKSNILSMRISFKIIATLWSLPQITIFTRLLLTRH